MEKLYELIEKKIRESGCSLNISGRDIYCELCDFIEEKEEGSYLFLSKKENDVTFEYKVDVMQDNFNLSYLRITEGDQIFYIDYDAPSKEDC